MRKPGFLPGFFLTVSSIADWVKLLCHADVVDSSMDVMFGGLTRFLVLGIGSGSI